MLHTYACKTLRPGFFLDAVDTNLFRIDPRKKFPDPGCFSVGGKAPTKTKKYIFFFRIVQIYMKDAECAETNEK